MGVEFAGLHAFEQDVVGLRRVLDDLGLVAAGAHVGSRALGPERIAQTIEKHQALGCKLLIVGGDKRFTDPSLSQEYADLMNVAAEKLRPFGMSCGHHNHTEEFTAVGQTTYWHLFGERTRPEVFLQLDLGWARTAGWDPAALISRHPGRVRTMHVKAKKGEDPILGQSAYDWRSVLDLAVSRGGAEWLMVEQEDYSAGTPKQSTERSFRGLRRIATGVASFGRSRSAVGR